MPDDQQPRAPDEGRRLMQQDAPPRWSRAELHERLLQFPHGHPSSPFNADGSRKPPPPDLRKLELPFPDEEGGGEEFGSGTWGQTAAALRAKWEEHEARWPAEEREPVDRTGDEPGSWRGDGGQFLNTEENIVAGHAHERVAAVEPEVTAAQEEIQHEVLGADLVGLEYRLKGEDRFKEKVAEGLALKPERAVEKVVAGIPDAVRYTHVFGRESYSDGYWAVRHKLEGSGYTLSMSRNSWDHAEYKGINTRWRSGEGQLFEVQFHTPESFEAKQLTHGAYERLRNPKTDRHEMAELRSFQQEVSRNIPVPDRVDTIPDYQAKRR